jgi:hypothetical protein
MVADGLTRERTSARKAIWTGAFQLRHKKLKGAPIVR